MTHSAVLFDVRNGIATLTLNEGARMNPLTPGLQQGCLDALQRVRDDASVRVLVLTALGKGFCVGADLAALGQGQREGLGVGERAFDVEQAVVAREALADDAARVHRTPAHGGGGGGVVLHAR